MLQHKALKIVFEGEVFLGLIAAGNAGTIGAADNAILATNAVDVDQLQVDAEGFVINFLRLREDNGSFNGVLQLSHIPWPRITL